MNKAQEERFEKLIGRDCDKSSYEKHRGLKSFISKELKLQKKEIKEMIEEERPHHEYCDAYKNHAEGNRGCLEEDAQDKFAFKLIKKL